MLEAKREAKDWQRQFEEAKDGLDDALTAHLDLHTTYLHSKSAVDDHSQEIGDLHRLRERESEERERLHEAHRDKDSKYADMKRLLENRIQDQETSLARARQEQETEHADLLLVKRTSEGLKHELWELNAKHTKLQQAHDLTLSELETLRHSNKLKQKGESGSINMRSLELMKQKEAEHAALHKQSMAALTKKEKERATLKAR